MKWIVAPGQTLLDVALMATGSVEGVLELAKLNGLTVGEPLEPGQVLIFENVIDQTMINAMQGDQVVAASGYPDGIITEDQATYWLATGIWNGALPWTATGIWKTI